MVRTKRNGIAPSQRGQASRPCTRLWLHRQKLRSFRRSNPFNVIRKGTAIRSKAPPGGYRKLLATNVWRDNSRPSYVKYPPAVWNEALALQRRINLELANIAWRVEATEIEYPTLQQCLNWVQETESEQPAPFRTHAIEVIDLTSGIASEYLDLDYESCDEE
jgi:hypothetical protein